MKKLKCYFFYIPARFEIEVYRAKDTLKEYFGMDDYDFNKPVDKLIDCAKENNLNFLSLKSYFFERKSLCNKYGDHWSPKATNLTAGILAKSIIQIV